MKFLVFFFSNYKSRLLKHVLTTHFDKYSEPVRDGTVSESSVVLLWRKIEPVFRVARASLFLKSEAKENESTLGGFPKMLQKNHQKMKFRQKKNNFAKKQFHKKITK